jgi:hypothetical protein
MTPPSVQIQMTKWVEHSRPDNPTFAADALARILTANRSTTSKESTE